MKIDLMSATSKRLSQLPSHILKRSTDRKDSRYVNPTTQVIILNKTPFVDERDKNEVMYSILGNSGENIITRDVFCNSGSPIISENLDPFREDDQIFCSRIQEDSSKRYVYLHDSPYSTLKRFILIGGIYSSSSFTPGFPILDRNLEKIIRNNMGVFANNLRSGSGSFAHYLLDENRNIKSKIT